MADVAFDRRTPLGRRREYEHRRRSSPVITINTDVVNTLPPIVPLLSPPLTPQTPSPRKDRLSLRLRSNSGLAGHTNEAVLSQYIDYQTKGSARPPPCSPPFYHEPVKNCARPTSARGTPVTIDEDVSWTTKSSPSHPPFLDILDLGSFRSVIDDPDASQRFMQYCKTIGYEKDLEFLFRTREYEDATNGLAAILTTISTSYIATGASYSLKLPPTLSEALCADIKHIARFMLPSLESLFAGPRSHVEKRMATNVFPAFVKTQFVQSLSTALVTETSVVPRTELKYIGLAESFCLAEGPDSENAITAVTDAFLSMTGYCLPEMIFQSCSLLQGPYTDAATVRRIRYAIRDERESTELIVNYRKDGTPFWNLFVLYPLKDQRRQLRHWLGGQVNISDSVTDIEDLLSLLRYGDEAVNASNCITIDRHELVHGKEKSMDAKRAKRPSHSRNSSRSSSSGIPLFQIRKRQGSTTLSLNSDHPNSSSTVNSIPSLPSQSHSFANQRFEPRPRIPPTISVYSHYMLLSCDPICTPPSRPAAALPFHTRKKPSLKLNVAFYSDLAPDLLSVCEDITDVDIFYLLGQRAGSPSVTKSFKSMIRDNIESGKTTSAEIVLRNNPTTPFERRRSTAGMRNSFMAESESYGSSRSEKRVAKTTKQEKLMSHWTPMRNAEGNFEWVVLILVPGN